MQTEEQTIMPQQLLEALFDLKKWDQLSREECVEIAFQVERLLPPSFRFTNLETFSSPADQHHIAYFEWTAPPGTALTYHDLQLDSTYPWHGLTENPESQEEWSSLPQEVQEKIQNYLEDESTSCSNKQHTTRFALIPGNTVTLGYDPDHPQLPNDELIFDAEKESLIPTIDGTWRTLDTNNNCKSRAENEAEDDYWRQKPRNYAAMMQYIEEELLPARTVTLRPFLLEQSYIHLGDLLGLVNMYQYEYTLFYQNYLKGRTKQFNKDEYYEVHFPFSILNPFPTSHKLAAELLKKQGFRLPSNDEWEYACMAGRKSLLFWEDSDKPFDYYPDFPQNTFGLYIARHSYDWELCMEPDILRGGDGGYSQCGWGGYLMHYLCYVSAYYQTCDDPTELSTYYFFRRAYSL
jgi:formylglycine-generating enzyme required for sulfatase activity